MLPGSELVTWTSRVLQFLFIITTLEWPLASGGQIRQWNILQGLLQAGETDVVVFQLDNLPVPHEPYVGCRRVVSVSGSYLRFSAMASKLYNSTPGRTLLTISTPYPFEYVTHGRNMLHQYLASQIDLSQYNAVWFSKARTAMAVGLAGVRASVLDGDDFDYVRELLVLRTSKWYGAKLLNYINVVKLYLWERGFSRRFTRVLRCSMEDVNRHPAENVLCVPNGTFVPDDLNDRSPAPRLLFVGTLGYEPNRQGIEWFLDQVWPVIRCAVPDAAFDIVGRDASPRISARHGQDGVAVHGFVPDLLPLYRTAAAAVVPLLAGGGTRLKILEALAHAVPVVSTSIGAFGISLPAQEGLLLADSASKFAARCIAVLHDPMQFNAAGLAGRNHVRKHYDWRAIQSLVAQIAHDSANTAVVTSAYLAS